MDKKVCYNESINKQTFIYNKILCYKLVSAASISIHRLRHVLTLVLAKYASLRTASIYDDDKVTKKLISLSNNLYNLEITYVTSDEHLNAILLNEETNQTLF